MFPGRTYTLWFLSVNPQPLDSGKKQEDQTLKIKTKENPQQLYHDTAMPTEKRKQNYVDVL